MAANSFHLDAVDLIDKPTMTHDEAQFQRINQTRAKLVGALRVALNGAGLKERNTQPPANRLMMAQELPINAPEGYDIERVIQAAAALRSALEPFTVFGAPDSPAS